MQSNLPPSVRLHLRNLQTLWTRAIWAHLEAQRLHGLGALPADGVRVAERLEAEAWRAYEAALLSAGRKVA